MGARASRPKEFPDFRPLITPFRVEFDKRCLAFDQPVTRETRDWLDQCANQDADFQDIARAGLSSSRQVSVFLSVLRATAGASALTKLTVPMPDMDDVWIAAVCEHLASADRGTLTAFRIRFTGAWGSVADIQRLFAAVQARSDLKTLGLLHLDHTCEQHALPALLGLLEGKATLEGLELSSEHDRAPRDGMWRAMLNVVQMVAASQHLRRVAFTHYVLGREASAYLQTLITNNAQLVELDVSFNALGPSTATALAAALRRNTVLTSLAVRGTEMGDELATLLEAVADHPALVSLDAGLCGAGGARVAAAAASAMQRLQRIRLDGNVMGFCGTVLATALAGPSLTSVDLSYNLLGHEFAAELPDVLQSHPTLTQLDIRGNFISSQHALALLSALEKNRVITDLQIGAGNFAERVDAALQGICARNRRLAAGAARPAAAARSGTSGPATGTAALRSARAPLAPPTQTAAAAAAPAGAAAGSAAPGRGAGAAVPMAASGWVSAGTSSAVGAGRLATSGRPAPAVTVVRAPATLVRGAV